MNWGTRIVFLYTGFVALILALVFGASSQDFHLVTENYYAEELDYQETILASQNAKALDIPMIVTTNLPDKEMLLTFPPAQSEVIGELTFYRPANADEDKVVVLRPTDRQQAVSFAGMSRGKWLAKIRWEHDGRTYFQEETLFIP